MLRSRLFWGIAGALLAMAVAARRRTWRRTAGMERAVSSLRSLAEAGIATAGSTIPRRAAALTGEGAPPVHDVAGAARS